MFKTNLRETNDLLKKNRILCCHLIQFTTKSSFVFPDFVFKIESFSKLWNKNKCAKNIMP